MKKHHKVRMRENKWYGYRPDMYDPRDYKFDHNARLSVALPPSVDLRPDCPPVMDQGPLGSCTAHGITGALRYLLVKKGGPRDHRLSRLQLYYDERALEGTIKEDAGAEIRDGIKCIARIGVAHETMWPYVIRKFARTPTPRVYKDAAQFLALRYERVTVAIDAIKIALSAGYPVIVGFAVFESFESKSAEDSGIIPMPNYDTEWLLGGHCVYVVGYGQKEGYFTCRNSWGTGWGDAGDFYLPYQYLGDPDLGGDYWIVPSAGQVVLSKKEHYGGKEQTVAEPANHDQPKS